jgi:hypothetical protein
VIMAVPNENYEVRNAEVEAKLKGIGQRMKQSMEEIPGYGFTLLIFSYGAGGDMFYISSAERATMIEALKELIKKLES